jgi:glycosyltransferase involved in cell wall biosynthesis
MKKISIIIPCFNEQEVIEQTYARLRGLALPEFEKEIIFIDDGSRDRTPEILKNLAAQDSQVRVLLFAKNFGHQPAVSAGIAHCTGDAAVVIDADLQDPPELIPEMIERWQAGNDIVYGKRAKRKGETIFKKLTAWGYYRVLNMLGGSYIPKDTGDFRLIDRKVCDYLNSLSEHNRFLRGLTAWAGFRSCPVEYVRDERAAGETKYTLKKMFRLAGDGIAAFSDKPLKLPLYFGIALMSLSLLYLVLSIVLAALSVWPVWHALFAVSFALISLLSIFIGVMGMYLGRMYDEAKNRPLYMIREKVNF